ncbi:MAG: zinc-binding dehydrogenase [Candidatus Lokiarchaeota archaeon]|nr:zinc-binding dehydrogenase [Candidatus Lokiarchaeota archaeon]MBD3340169.1 zinc-binding dehydrogenase [Candidatus Lokiarchaeota archaeon]
MKAIVWTDYGPPDVLQLQEVEKPVPNDNEVLIKVYATTVTAGDCELRNLDFSFVLRTIFRLSFGLKKPKRVKILGMELAGIIEAVGKNVKLFKKGDHVFGSTGMRFGAYAEYACLPEEWNEGALAIKPVNITFEEAATVPIGCLEAYYFLEKANVKTGDNVLILGASGTIGTVAIQLVKYFGAKVTAVGNPNSLDVMKSIGADKTMDYTKDDFMDSQEKYDVIFDVVGKYSFSDCKKALKKKGMLLLANPKLSTIVRGLLSSIKVKTGSTSYTKERLSFLKNLIEMGELKPVIVKQYSLEEIPEAHKFVEEGQKVGDISITIEPNH